MAKLLGRDLLLMMNDTVVGMLKGCDIEYSGDTIEVSSPNSGTARDFIPGRTTWSVTCNRLIPADVTATSLRAGFFLAVNKTVGLHLWVRGTNARPLGTAICTKCTISAQVGQVAKGSFAFCGTGQFMGL